MRPLLALALAVLLLAARPAPAQEAAPPERIRLEVATLTSQVVACSGAEVAFVSTESSLNVLRGHGWILSLWVADAPAYGGEYFVLSELDGRLTGELLAAPGPEGTRRLEGDALTGYLARVALDAAPVRAAFARYYAAAPPGR
jgi:hypothetical protein